MSRTQRESVPRRRLGYSVLICTDFGKFVPSFSSYSMISLIKGGYKTKTEDLRPKNEDPVKNVLKSLKKGSNMILDRSRNKEHQDLQLSTNLTRVFVLYITLRKVQNEDPVKTVLKSLEIT